MERTVKLRAVADPEAYDALKEVEREYREILVDAIEYGLARGALTLGQMHRGLYRVEREKHRGLPSQYVVTALRDALARLRRFLELKRQGRVHTDKPAVRSVTVLLNAHLWRFTPGEVRVAVKNRVWVSTRPTLDDRFWSYYNGGWRLASDARFKLLGDNVVEYHIIFERVKPEPYTPQGFIPVDLNEDNVAVLLDGQPLLLETNLGRFMLGRGRGGGVGRAGRLNVAGKLASLIVRAALDRRSAIVLENLPDRAPERMVRDGDSQLRLRVYRAAFTSVKRAIIEKAGEHGVPVILVNPARTSTVCPIHGSPIDYQPGASRVGRCRVGGELWHRDVVALYNLLRRAGGEGPEPPGSPDPLVLRFGVWLRAKTLDSALTLAQTRG